MSNPAPAPASVNYYRDVASMLRARFERLHNARNADWLDISAWMVRELRGGVSPGTWRSYRASVIWASQDPLVAQTLNIPGTRAGRRNGAARRASEITAEQIAELRDVLHAEDTVVGPLAYDWFESTLLTGLRPGEWRTASIVSGRAGTLVLRVKTIKQKVSERRSPSLRLIPLAHLNADQLDSITRVLTEVKALDGDADAFRALHESVAGCIRRHCRLLWPKAHSRPGLYTARHQFRNNCFAAGLTAEEVAALMGHTVVTTAKRIYGHRHPIGTHAAPRPLKSEMEAFFTHQSERAAAQTTDGTATV